MHHISWTGLSWSHYYYILFEQPLPITRPNRLCPEAKWCQEGKPHTPMQWPYPGQPHDAILAETVLHHPYHETKPEIRMIVYDSVHLEGEEVLVWRDEDLDEHLEGESLFPKSKGEWNCRSAESWLREGEDPHRISVVKWYFSHLQ